MDPIKKAAEIVGSQKLLAQLLGVTNGAISQWAAPGKVPVDRCIDIEKATNGRVKCEDLRPDMDWTYLRGTNCEQKAA